MTNTNTGKSNPRTNNTATTVGSRAWHEDEAVRACKEASELATTGARRGRFTTSTRIARLTSASRLAGQARTHLTSIGAHEGPRTLRLWALVSKVDRMIDEALERELARIARADAE